MLKNIFPHSFLKSTTLVESAHLHTYKNLNMASAGVKMIARDMNNFSSIFRHRDWLATTEVELAHEEMRRLEIRRMTKTELKESIRDCPSGAYLKMMMIRKISLMKST